MTQCIKHEGLHDGFHRQAAMANCPSCFRERATDVISTACRKSSFRVQELCESRGGRPGRPVPNSPYGLCGRKATLDHKRQSAGAEWPGFTVPNILYCLCVRKAALSSKSSSSSDGHPDLCGRERLIPNQTFSLVVRSFHNGHNCDNTHGTSRQSSISGGANQAYPFIPKRCCGDHILPIASCSDMY